VSVVPSFYIGMLHCIRANADMTSTFVSVLSRSRRKITPQNYNMKWRCTWTSNELYRSIHFMGEDCWIRALWAYYAFLLSEATIASCDPIPLSRISFIRSQDPTKHDVRTLIIFEPMWVTISSLLTE
jgi:hypothetical protein